jgi:osmotically-inducible protein OsmY
MKLYALFAAAGAALVYFLDPQNGRRRRGQAVDRTAGLVRRLGRRVKRAGRGAASEVSGLGRKAAHMREESKPQPNDAALAEKVSSEVFRDPSIPKGQINVNAENGVVYLRGQVESADLVQRLERAVRDVQGVRDVENLLQTGAEPPASQGD